MDKQKNIVVYVNNLPISAVESVRCYEKEHKTKLRIMLLRDSRSKRKTVDHGADILVECDFFNSSKIAESLLPYQDQLVAITCRSESNIAKFIQVIPHVPYLRTPSTESLRWATDKYEMRRRFRLFDPKHTPRFTWVKNSTKKERDRVIEKVKFPMIIKPASLAGSALVSICYHEEELEKTLRSSFRKLKKMYQTDGRSEVPKLMAEEYMEGDMYSIDAYVNSRGQIFYCPLVKVVTGQSIGHDDFYNYLRITPTKLNKESIDKAQQRVEMGVKALSLSSTTVHVELIRYDNDWRIIEIGPRMGGFRHVLHKLSCDIDHSLNDLLIRFPKKPIIPKKCKGYAATLRYYAGNEGRIVKMTGIKRIKELGSYHSMQVKLKIGERAQFAKNGGKGVFDLTMYNSDRSKLLADIRRVEKLVEIKVKNGRKA